MSSIHKDTEFDNESRAEHVLENPKTVINQPNAAIYAEAIARYPNDESIDQADEQKLKRKLDRRIIPLLGICYFFYVSRYVKQSGLSQIAQKGITKLTLLLVCRQDYSVLCCNLWYQG